MISKKNEVGKQELLPLAIIKAAASGDTEAINIALQHFEGYIASLSTTQLFDTAGNIYNFVDENIRRHLEISLITNILKFFDA